MPRRPTRSSRAPLAIASDGSVLVNAITWTTDNDLDAVIDAAKAHGGTVFVGVIMPKSKVGQVLRRLEDFCAEVAGRRW